jgi:DNA polymerase III alpha subunit
VDEWPAGERLRNEKEVLGFYVSGHPLDKVRAQLAAFARSGVSSRASAASATSAATTWPSSRSRTTRGPSR